MTNKEAAEFIWDVLDGTKSFNEKGGRGLEALDLAIKALKNEKESELIKAYTKGFDTGVETVKSERKKGAWIRLQAIGDYKCSICGCENLYKYANEHERWIKTISNFCPNCGADMRGAE